MSNRQLNPIPSTLSLEYQQEILQKLNLNINLEQIQLPEQLPSVDVLQNLIIEPTSPKTNPKYIVAEAPNDVRLFMNKGLYFEAMQLLQFKYGVDHPAVVSLFIYCLGKLEALSIFAPFLQQLSAKLEQLDPLVLSEAFTVAMYFLNIKRHRSIISQLFLIMIQNRIPITEGAFMTYLKTIQNATDLESIVYAGKPRMQAKLFAEVVSHTILLNVDNVDNAAKLYKFSRQRSLYLKSKTYDILFFLFLKHEKYLDLASEIGFSGLQKIKKVGVVGESGFVEEMTITLILQACAAFGNWKLAEFVWLKMLQLQITPDIQAFYAAIEAYGKGKQYLSAFRTINLFLEHHPKIQLDYKTFQIIASVVGKNGADACACADALQTMHLNGEKIHHSAVTIAVEALSVAGEETKLLSVLDSLSSYGVLLNQYILEAITTTVSSEIVMKKLVQLCREMGSNLSAKFYCKFLFDAMAKQNSKSVFEILDILNRSEVNFFPIEYMEEIIANLKKSSLSFDDKVELVSIINSILITKFKFSEKHAHAIIQKHFDQ